MTDATRSGTAVAGPDSDGSPAARESLALLDVAVRSMGGEMRSGQHEMARHFDEIDGKPGKMELFSEAPGEGS